MFERISEKRNPYMLWDSKYIETLCSTYLFDFFRERERVWSGEVGRWDYPE